MEKLLLLECNNSLEKKNRVHVSNWCEDLVTTAAVSMMSQVSLRSF